MLENRELMVFWEVANTLNMTKAAHHLHMTEPTVSRIIKSLEEHLGYKLFKRGTRTLTLTKSGELLQERAQVILNLVHDLEHEFDTFESNISGKINIGLAETPAFRQIASLLVKMRQRYPQVIFGIESGNAEQVCAKLDQGLYDFGLVVASFPNAEQYQCLTLPQPDIWGVILPLDHPLAQKEALTPADLKDQPLLFSRQEQLASVRPLTKHLAAINTLGGDSVSSNTLESDNLSAPQAPQTGETDSSQVPNNSKASSSPKLSSGSKVSLNFARQEARGSQQNAVAKGASFKSLDKTQGPKVIVSAANSLDNSLKVSVPQVETVLLRDVIAAAAKPQKALIQEEPNPQEQELSDSPLKTWFGPYWKQLNIVTSFNLIYNAALLVEAKMGLALSIDGIIDLTNHPNLCFRPLSPQVSSGVSIIWPRFRSFTPAARLLRDEFISSWDKQS